MVNGYELGDQVLNHCHRNARIVWTRSHVRWTRSMWSSVPFSGASRFNLSTADGRVRVFRRKGKRIAQKCLKSAQFLFSISIDHGVNRVSVTCTKMISKKL